MIVSSGLKNFYALSKWNWQDRILIDVRPKLQIKYQGDNLYSNANSLNLMDYERCFLM